MRKWLLKRLMIAGSTLLGLILITFLLPYFFPEFVAKKIKIWSNQALATEVNFSKARLSFFNHFPSLTLTLHNFTLKGSAPFSNANLVAADEVALGIDLRSVFESKININQIFLDKGKIDIQVSEEGIPNYNVYKSEPDTAATTASTDSAGASLRLENIHLDETELVYNDRSLPMTITAKGFHYTGSGDLSKAIFDLHSDIKADSFLLSYDGQTYITDKKLQAELITKINTNSLTLLFEKNDLLINRLPVQLHGIFEFMKDGYNMDFTLRSKETDLHDVISAIPQEYLKYFDNTEIKGHTEIEASLKGNYIASTNAMPSLLFNMKVKDGFVSHNKAALPAKNLRLNLDARLPGLNTDSLYISIDSFFFNIDKDYFNSVVLLRGLNVPYLKSSLQADMDLGNMAAAFGLKDMEFKGRYKLNFNADGTYTTGQRKGSLRKDTVITSIPKFNLESSLTGGFVKFAALPQGVEQISLKLNASCKDGVYEHTQLNVQEINAKVLSNFIKGHFNITNEADFPLEGQLQTVFHLSDIKQFYPLDSLDLDGDLNIDINTKGKYNPAKKLFPVTTALLKLNNGSVKTKYYHSPLQKIKVDVAVINNTGKMNDLKVELKPVSFELDNLPFIVQASLQQFSDLRYAIVSKGTLDLGKLYKVFAIQGYNVNGYIQTNLSLRGRQSDATAGRYEKLFNKGTMKVRDIALTTEMLPKPFFINNGLFRFDQDKMWFDTFKANYGNTNMVMNGYLFNVFNYAFKPEEALKGKFELSTPKFFVDEWMVFSGEPDASASTSTASGVVVIPKNLDLTFTANAGKVLYQGIELYDFKGGITVANGELALQETGFTVVDAPIVMDGTYKSSSPYKAYFDYHVKAETLDVKKAYKGIDIFRQMAPAAAKAEGQISLDYSLSGRLNASMMPVYPSLKGEGIISVQKVKMKGFRLMNAVSDATGKEGIKDPDLSKVDIKTKIANNIITIERVKMKVSGFRPRFEGQVSFDGKFNLHGRLGLPPFGIIGIPFSVTGNRDNPKVKLRRSKDGDELEEEKDEEEIKTDSTVNQ
jgi:AsmA protein